MFKLNSPLQWLTLKAKTPTTFGVSPKETRKVVFQFSCSERANIYVNDMFLCSVDFVEKIEFHIAGKFTLSSDKEVKFVTAESLFIHSKSDEDGSFTTVVEREPRNPALELAMYKMKQNNERLIQNQLHTASLRLARANAKAVKSDEATVSTSDPHPPLREGSAATGTAVSEPDGDSGSPAAPSSDTSSGKSSDG